MLLDLCRENEGNPFSTRIWIVGSYTDTLLRMKQVNFKARLHDLQNRLVNRAAWGRRAVLVLKEFFLTAQP